MTKPIDGSRPQDLVSEFHRVYQMPNALADGSTPTVDIDRIGLRMDLVSEEFSELVGAVYGAAAAAQIESVTATLPDQHERDAVETADALADMVYVIYGMALECGIDLDAVLAEVHRSNLSKLMPDGSVRRREDGKILKGPDFSAPDIKTVLFGTVAPDSQGVSDVG